ncbi:MAG: hypothetical protein PF904_10810 [Kiritimatiellae bacterium]|jgi:hypothetical protein|nr:hypothetical protein [Kiritimatiellia bacterium]
MNTATPFTVDDAGNFQYKPLCENMHIREHQLCFVSCPGPSMADRLHGVFRAGLSFLRRLLGRCRAERSAIQNYSFDEAYHDEDLRLRSGSESDK